MRQLSIGAKNRAALTTALLYLSHGGYAQTTSDFVQQIAEGSLQLSPLWLVQTGSSENASTIFKQSTSTEESNWMSMIDLIQRTELQLDPILDLQKDFDSATETFFSVLEEAEQKNEAVVEDSARQLRTAISNYEEACEQIMESFGTLMEERKSQESLAVESLKVVTKASINKKEKKEKAKQEQLDKSEAEAKSEDSSDEDEVVLETAQTGVTQENNSDTKADDSDKAKEAATSDGNEDKADDTSKDSEEKPESVDSSDNDDQDKDKEEEKEEKAPEVDTNSPLGQLVVELRMLEKLTDRDLVSVCYGSEEATIF